MLSRKCLAFVFLLLAAGCVPAARAQMAAPGIAAGNPRNFDATSFGERITLGPDWLFAPGDNPAYASPEFVDSGWKTISTEKDLLDFGYRDLPYAWYRLHVQLRPGTRNLMVGMKDVEGNYEVYANGVRIGGSGKMTGVLISEHSALAAYAVPDGLISPRGDLTLAIRIAINWGAYTGHGTCTPLHADSVFLVSRESAPREASYVAAHNAGAGLLLFGLSLIAGLISFVLYLALRSQTEYLAVAIYLLVSSLATAIGIWFSLNTLTLILIWGLLAVEMFALVELVRLVLRLPRTRWILALEVVSSLAYIVEPIFELGIGPFYLDVIEFSLTVLVVKALLPVLLLRGWLRGNREAGMLLPAILLCSLADYFNSILNLAYVAHLTLRRLPQPTVHLGSYVLDFWAITNFVFYIALLLFLVQRTFGIAHERAQAATELEAARNVQHVLIPEEIPSTPGFTIHSVYKPAGEVGGDFFQILPLSGGGVLAVIGDVSGKGMPAAMTVSLLVGTVRTLAYYTQSPGETLAAMNQRMLGRSRGGFTTCLVLRADPEGKLTVANAGHIAPYLAGNELPLENGLPLGISAETTYAESTFQLAAGQQLTLLTDGVVEARDKAGSLLGFERTAQISIQPAEAIAQAAQEFGQEDDITVVTLARTA
jgi:hypothetical protein